MAQAKTMRRDMALGSDIHQVSSARAAAEGPVTGGARRVAVIGAGLAGLAAAEQLSREGLDVVVFEARGRVGGRVWSVPFRETTAERGAEFILPHDATTLAFCERLGLPLFVKGTQYGDREPRDAACTADAVLEAARLLAEAARGGSVGTVSSVADALELDAATREAVVARVEVSSTATASEQAASVLAETAVGFGRYDTWSVAGGNQRIAEALASRLGRAVHLSTPVHRVSSHAHGICLTAGGAQVDVDACVIAVPPTLLGDLGFDPPLPTHRRHAVAAVRLGRAAKVAFGLRRAVRPSAVLSVRGRFWTSTQLLPDGRWSPVGGSFAGGAAAVAALGVEDGPDRWLHSIARLQPELDVEPGGALLSTWHDDPWVRGSYSVATVDGALADPLLVEPFGRLTFAGEHTAGALHGTMNGALASGLRAAEQTLALLRPRQT